MLGLALTVITIAYLAVASFTDIRQRIVPDWLSYSMIAIGILLHAGVFVFFGQAQALAGMIGALIVSLALSLMLWKIGFWAGGDVKLFLAIAALNPINYGAVRDMLSLSDRLFGSIELPVFPVTLFVFSVYALLPMGLMITARKISKSSEAKSALKKGFKKSAIKTFFFSLLASGIAAIVSHYSIHPAAGLIAVLIALLFAKKFLNALSAAVFAAGFSLDAGVVENALLLFAAGILLVLFLRLAGLSRSDALRKKVLVEKLEEGMISAVTIVEKEGKITIQESPIKSILKHLKENNVAGLKELLMPQGRMVVSSASADGLEKKQIKELIELAEKGLIEKEISVKESTAFVPAVLAGYILLSAVGDILWNVIL